MNHRQWQVQKVTRSPIPFILLGQNIFNNDSQAMDMLYVKESIHKVSWCS